MSGDVHVRFCERLEGWFLWATLRLLLTNGSKAEAMRLKEEFSIFLKEELQLELSPEKTHITHVNDGIDFLGFHIQRYVSGHDRPKMLVTPALKNIKKFKQTIKEMTKRKWFQDSPLLKFSAILIFRESIGQGCH